MKEKVVWQGQEYELEWFDEVDEVLLNNLQQVYGFLFNVKGELCVVRPTEKRGWRLPGGGPEPEDKDWKETVMREADEEADVVIDPKSLKIIGIIKNTPLGENCEKDVGYALRVVGKIIQVNEQTEDIAESLINEREFISPDKFLEYCPWGEIGKKQIEKALRVMGR